MTFYANWVPRRRLQRTGGIPRMERIEFNAPYQGPPGFIYMLRLDDGAMDFGHVRGGLWQSAMTVPAGLIWQTCDLLQCTELKAIKHVISVAYLNAARRAS